MVYEVFTTAQLIELEFMVFLVVTAAEGTTGNVDVARLAFIFIARGIVLIRGAVCQLNGQEVLI